MTTPMKRKRIVITGAVLLLFLYIGSYCVLRLTRYLVRQEFLSERCSKQIRDNYPDDRGPVKDGYTWYSFESERNQIGCGRIQKDRVSFGESVLRPAFRPLAEMELQVRGFNRPSMWVHKNVAEFERYDAESNAVYYMRTVSSDQLRMDR